MNISKKNITVEDSIVARINNASDTSNITGTDDDVITAKIEVSSTCNFRCTFCCYSKMDLDREKLMNVNDFKNVVNQLLKKYKNLKEIGLFYIGEPGFNPNLKEMYKYLKQKNIYTYLTTNGSYIKNILEAVPWIDSLKVSWNYINELDFINKTKQYKDVYYNIIENIEVLYQECHKSFKKLSISTVLDDNDPNEYLKTIKKHLVYDEHYFIPMQNHGGFLKDGKDGVVGTQLQQREPLPCWSLFKGVYVDANFNIRPCCYAYSSTRSKVKFGKITKDNIIISEYEQNMKEQQLQGFIPDYCKNCLRNYQLESKDQ